MSSCNGNCASCSSDCGDRKKESLLAAMNPKSNIKKVIAEMTIIEGTKTADTLFAILAIGALPEAASLTVFIIFEVYS